jgi:hypothetical protein
MREIYCPSREWITLSAAIAQAVRVSSPRPVRFSGATVADISTRLWRRVTSTSISLRGCHREMSDDVRFAA